MGLHKTMPDHGIGDLDRNVVLLVAKPSH
jgi:hypothetical protein